MGIGQAYVPSHNDEDWTATERGKHTLFDEVFPLLLYVLTGQHRASWKHMHAYIYIYMIYVIYC